MRLRHSPTSPYVRKVMITAHELGLADRIELVPTATATDPTLPKLNPLSKVPTMELDDGTVIFDSPVIVDYLDDLAGRKLTPAAGPARWSVLTLHALADGICDAAFAHRMESLRVATEQSPAFLVLQDGKIDRGLDALERRAGSLGPLANIGDIATAAALGYIDFRFDHKGWRTTRPTLAAWFADVSERPSVRLTKPA